MLSIFHAASQLRWNRGCWAPLRCHVQKTHLIADTEGHLGNLDIDEGVVHSSSLLHLVDVIDRMLEEGNAISYINLFFLFLTSDHNQSKSTNTSGAFLNDLLTPAVRFSPWATPLLGPIAPMVSSDDCRGLTGIPVTQSPSASALWPLGDSVPYTLHSHWVSLSLSHTLTRSYPKWNSLLIAQWMT